MKKLMIASACLGLAACGGSSNSGLKINGELNTNTPESNIELAQAGDELQETTVTLTSLLNGEEQSQDSMTGYSLQSRQNMACEYSGSFTVSGTETSSSVSFNDCMFVASSLISGGVSYKVESMDENTGSFSIRMDYNDLQVTVDGEVTTTDGDITSSVSITDTAYITTLSGSSLAVESSTGSLLMQQFKHSTSMQNDFTNLSIDFSYYIATDAGTFYVYTDGAIVNGEGRVIIEGANAQYIVVYSGGAIDESASGLDLEKDGEIDNASSEEEPVSNEEAA